MCKFRETIPLNYLQKHIENGIFLENPRNKQVTNKLAEKFCGAFFSKKLFCLKGQSHEKFCEIIPLNEGSGPN
jgi:hypothetical protein